MSDYNPLLDCEAAPVLNTYKAQWQIVCEGVDAKIERAARKKQHADVFKWLNVMDLLCTETAEWWRVSGRRLYANENTKADNTNRATARSGSYRSPPERGTDAISIL